MTQFVEFLFTEIYAFKIIKPLPLMHWTFTINLLGFENNNFAK